MVFSRPVLTVWLVVSCFAVVLLPIWAAMLFQHSKAFELPTALKTNAGWACVVAAVIYLCSGSYCLFHTCYGQSDRFRLWRSYGSDIRRVEMESLLRTRGRSSSRASDTASSSSPSSCEDERFRQNSPNLIDVRSTSLLSSRYQQVPSYDQQASHLSAVFYSGGTNGRSS